MHDSAASLSGKLWPRILRDFRDSWFLEAKSATIPALELRGAGLAYREVFRGQQWKSGTVHGRITDSKGSFGTGITGVDTALAIATEAWPNCLLSRLTGIGAEAGDSQDTASWSCGLSGCPTFLWLLFPVRALGRFPQPHGGDG